MFACLAVTTIAIAWVTWRTWPRILRNTEAMVYLFAMILMLGPILVGTLVSLVRGLPRIVLEANGLAFDTLLFSYTRAWSEVGQFKSRLVYVALSDAGEPRD